MSGKIILVIDDEEELLRAMRVRLASWGYDVITAVNGKEALPFIKSKVADAVILDIMMPEMDGVETLRRIRSFDKKIPVFMLTAYGDEDKFERTRKLGISGFIPKGREFVDASEAIRVVLKGTRKPQRK